MDPNDVLVPNQLITLEYAEGGIFRAYSSRIEDISSDSLCVAWPSEKGELVSFKWGSEVGVFLSHQTGMLFGATRVIGQQLDPLPLLILTKPDILIKRQRRRFLRVKATVFPADAWVLDPDPARCRQIKVVIIDISGGGIRFVGDDLLTRGTKIRLKLDLPFACGAVDAIASVLRVDVRDGSNRGRFETAAAFSQICEGDRDRICKFALRQQLEAAKQGDLWR